MEDARAAVARNIAREAFQDARRSESDDRIKFDALNQSMFSGIADDERAMVIEDAVNRIADSDARDLLLEVPPDPGIPRSDTRPEGPGDELEAMLRAQNVLAELAEECDEGRHRRG